MTNGIVNSDINSAAAIVDSKLATISTAGKVLNSATTATAANTANALVARDAVGNFYANRIYSNVTGNLTGYVSGSATLNILKSGDTMSGALILPAGTAVNPSLQFTGSTNTGLSSVSNTLALSTNGAAAITINPAGNVTVSAPSSGVGLTVNGGGESIVGDTTTTGNLTFNTAATTLNAIGSVQSPLVKIFTGSDNTGLSGSVSVDYTAAGFANAPQIFLAAANGLLTPLGAGSVTTTSATINSGGTLSVPFNYFAIGV